MAKQQFEPAVIVAVCRERGGCIAPQSTSDPSKPNQVLTSNLTLQGAGFDQPEASKQEVQMFVSPHGTLVGPIAFKSVALAQEWLAGDEGSAFKERVAGYGIVTIKLEVDVP